MLKRLVARIFYGLACIAFVAALIGLALCIGTLALAECMEE